MAASHQRHYGSAKYAVARRVVGVSSIGSIYQQQQFCSNRKQRLHSNNENRTHTARQKSPFESVFNKFRYTVRQVFQSTADSCGNSTNSVTNIAGNFINKQDGKQSKFIFYNPAISKKGIKEEKSSAKTKELSDKERAKKEKEAAAKEQARLDRLAEEEAKKAKQEPATQTTPDIITLQSGGDIKAIVQSVGEDVIKYKKIDNPTGPTYSVRKSEVFVIKYASGRKSVFSNN